MSEFIPEEFEEEVVDIYQPTETKKLDIDSDEPIVVDEDIDLPYLSPIGIRYLFTDDIKEEIIKYSIRSLFVMNPKFRTDNTLVMTVFSVMKSIFIEKQNHILLKAPTGAGKTIIAFGINFCVTYTANMLYQILHDNNIPESDALESLLIDLYKEIESTHLIGMGENGTMVKVQVKGPDGKPVVVNKLTQPISIYERKQFDMNNDNHLGINTYLLTSSKMLQEQLDDDINNTFNLGNYYQMLKGSGNYECTQATERTKQYTSYIDRDCLIMKPNEKASLPCFTTCPYMVQRWKTSESQTAIFNYFYFLNVLRRDNPFFTKRTMTIADEGHLLPEIILSTFNVELTNRVLNNLLEILTVIQSQFASVEKSQDFQTICMKLGELYIMYTNKITGPKNIQYRVIALISERLLTVKGLLDKFITDNNYGENTFFVQVLNKKIKKIFDFIDAYELHTFVNKIEDRLEDMLIESNENIRNFKFTNEYAWFVNYIPNTSYNPYYGLNLLSFGLKDMKEAEMSRQHFMNKTDISIHMSATFSNMDNHAIDQLGIDEGNYKSLILPPIFTYKNSPIHLQMSGWLNHANFKENIGNVIEDTIDICLRLHPDDQGIIHTANFNITKLLQERVESLPHADQMRFLFYNDSKEKENAIRMMYLNKNNKSTIKYIICGPSLYEGLDLKQDFGRFNILMKVPYAGMSDYTKAKMERYPNWYKNTTIEKVQQAIGRTDREEEDWSITYLMDSSFKKFSESLPPYIVKRLKNKRN